MEASGPWYSLGRSITIRHDASLGGVAGIVAAYVASRTGNTPQRITLTAAETNAHAEDAEFAHGEIRMTAGGAEASLGEEGYALSIGAGGVVLRARTAHGAFNGWQTLRQIFDQSKGAGDAANAVLTAPVCEIVDVPRFAWRGMHLDVSRHFMPIGFVKRYIDLLAYHKFNVFHWHLTDDQGWRIEIRKYPKLTQVGAWRGEGDNRYGGYYTQDEIREVVAYAAERFVTIVPEIEMPGHAMAALAAHPELSCTRGPFEVPTTWGVFKDVYCAGNDEALGFIENVLDEVSGLFPGDYVHVGGDECPKDRWKTCDKCQLRMAELGLKDEAALQGWFMKQASRMLDVRGKRMIGWDEILEGGLAPSAAVMSWRGMEGGIEAAKTGHDVVMCPTSHCYFDYRQSAAPFEKGPVWSPVVDTEEVYAFDPMPSALNRSQQRHILGGQGNVWTEWLETSNDVEYMAFPRACALSEVLWSAPDHRDWPAFRERLSVHLKRLAAMDVNYRPSDAH